MEINTTADEVSTGPTSSNTDFAVISPPLSAL